MGIFHYNCSAIGQFQINAHMLKIKGLSKTEKEAIEEVKNRLVKKYADRLLLLKLYGSKAREDSRSDSDIDLLIVVDKDGWDMSEKIFDEIYEVMDKYDFKFFISMNIFEEEEFDFYRTHNFSFYKNVKRDGIDLWKKETT
jgi:predicted nucleotidyltransferase